VRCVDTKEKGRVGNQMMNADSKWQNKPNSDRLSAILLNPRKVAQGESGTLKIPVDRNCKPLFVIVRITANPEKAVPKVYKHLILP
jgi:hypothetical protein